MFCLHCSIMPWLRSQDHSCYSERLPPSCISCHCRRCRKNAEGDFHFPFFLFSLFPFPLPASLESLLLGFIFTHSAPLDDQMQLRYARLQAGWGWQKLKRRGENETERLRECEMLRFLKDCDISPHVDLSSTNIIITNTNLVLHNLPS